VAETASIATCAEICSDLLARLGTVSGVSLQWLRRRGASWVNHLVSLVRVSLPPRLPPRPLEEAMLSAAARSGRVFCTRSPGLRLAATRPRQSLRAFSSSNDGERGATTNIKEPEPLAWEWVPPDNANRQVEEHVVEEESLGVGGGTRSERRERIKAWLEEAKEILDPRGKMIKVKPGVELTTDEVMISLQLNDLYDIVLFEEAKDMHTFVATARSQTHMLKTLQMLSKSMKARNLPPQHPTLPYMFGSDWSAINMGSIGVHIMSAAGRVTHDIESRIDPIRKEEIENELWKEMDSSMMEEFPHLYKPLHKKYT